MVDLIKDIVDRAMFLGISCGYIDVDNIFYIDDGKLYIDLGKYIKAHTKDSSKDTYKIDVMDGVYGVFIESFYDSLIKNKDYIITFPQSLYGVSENYDDFHKGSIKFKVYSGEGVLSNSKNVILDFSACDYIKDIAPNGFYMSYFKGLYFGNIDMIHLNAFQEASIKDLSFKGVKNIMRNAFYSATIPKCDLGNTLELVDNGGLEFYEGPDVLILNHVDTIKAGALSGIENVYLGYDLYTYSNLIVKMLNKVIKSVDKNDSYSSILMTLDDLVSDIYSIKNSTVNKYLDVERKLCNYYESISKNNLDALVESVCSLYTKENCDVLCYNIYLYDRTNMTDIKSRKYHKVKSVNNKICIDIYLDDKFTIGF